MHTQRKDLGGLFAKDAPLQLWDVDLRHWCCKKSHKGFLAEAVTLIWFPLWLSLLERNSCKALKTGCGLTRLQLWYSILQPKTNRCRQAFSRKQGAIFCCFKEFEQWIYLELRLHHEFHQVWLIWLSFYEHAHRCASVYLGQVDQHTNLQGVNSNRHFIGQSCRHLACFVGLQDCSHTVTRAAEHLDSNPLSCLNFPESLKTL